MGAVRPYLTSSNAMPLPSREELRNRILQRKGVSNSTPATTPPTPSFGYSSLSGNTMTIQPYGGTNPFAGMTFGGTPSASTGLLGLGQNVSTRPSAMGSVNSFSPSFTGYGTRGYSPANGLNLGLGYGMSPHTILLNPAFNSPNSGQPYLSDPVPTGTRFG